MKWVKQKADNRNWLYTRDQLWVANTYGPLEVGAVLCSVALSHAGGENGACSAITERALLVLSGGPVTPTPIREYNGLRDETRGPFKGQQASASNPVMTYFTAITTVMGKLKKHSLTVENVPLNSLCYINIYFLFDIVSSFCKNMFIDSN